jgi:hypothetical protein
MIVILSLVILLTSFHFISFHFISFTYAYAYDYRLLCWIGSTTLVILDTVEM